MGFSIDLCVPAYLAEDYLPELLESATKQNPPFGTIIVCVDDSPDNTEEVARSLGATVVVNESNLGCPGSKNRALEQATSEWVHFLDADDVLLPNFTAVAKRESERLASADVILMAYEYRDRQSNQFLATGKAITEELQKDPVRYCIRNIVPNFGIYKREALIAVGGFDTDPEVLYNEDAAFHLKLALAGKNFGASSEVSSINWKREESMSASHPIKCLLAQQVVMRNAAAKVDEHYFPDIAKRLWEIARGLASHKKWRMLRDVLDDAESIYPKTPDGQSTRFRILVSLLGAYNAFVIRENSIRLFKPHLRKSGP